MGGKIFAHLKMPPKQTARKSANGLRPRRPAPAAPPPADNETLRRGVQERLNGDSE